MRVGGAQLRDERTEHFDQRNGDKVAGSHGHSRGLGVRTLGSSPRTEYILE